MRGVTSVRGNGEGEKVRREVLKVQKGKDGMDGEE
jgi:hypothetical protein